MIRYKVNYNMNAIREPSDPMEGDLQMTRFSAAGSKMTPETITKVNSERYILIQNEISV